MRGAQLFCAAIAAARDDHEAQPVVATRCFKTPPDSKTKTIKWIFYSKVEDGLRDTFEDLAGAGALQAIGIKLMRDSAPMAKVAKNVSTILDSLKGKGKGKGKRGEEESQLRITDFFGRGRGGPRGA